jgi:hypothetical protein
MGDDPDKMRKIAEVLAPAYSEAHGKTFIVPEDVIPSREHGVDFILRAEDRTVAQFQHTQPAGDVQADRVRPAKAQIVIDALKKCMNERRVFGVFVSLNFHALPRNQEEAEKIAWYVCSFIAQKIRSGFRFLFTYDRHDHEPGLLGPLTGWISRLDVMPIRDSDRSSIGWSSDPLEPHSNAVMPDDIKFKEAADRKSTKYGSVGDVVLVVEFDPYPVDDFYIRIIRDDNKNATYPFREIWAVNNPLGDRKCWKVWPWAGGEDEA